MNYEHVFRARGAAYARAMIEWPDARADDFRLPLARAALRPGEVVVDVPSGRGDLRDHLPAGVHWRGHEPCASFFGVGEGTDRPLVPLPWPEASADVAVSVAGVHHVADRRPLYRELRRVLQPQGRLVLADVHRESSVARFLDEFVGRHNSTGHRGHYLDDAEPAVLADCGFDVTAVERIRYPWRFASERAMTGFFRLLFDLREIDDGRIIAGVDRLLGLRADGARGVGIGWELCVIAARAAD